MTLCVRLMRDVRELAGVRGYGVHGTIMLQRRRNTDVHLYTSSIAAESTASHGCVPKGINAARKVSLKIWRVADDRHQ